VSRPTGPAGKRAADRGGAHHRRLCDLPVARLSVPVGGWLRAAALHREARHLPRAHRPWRGRGRPAPTAAGYGGGDDLDSRSTASRMKSVRYSRLPLSFLNAASMRLNVPAGNFAAITSLCTARITSIDGMTENSLVVSFEAPLGFGLPERRARRLISKTGFCARNDAVHFQKNSRSPSLGFVQSLGLKRPLQKRLPLFAIPKLLSDCALKAL
jgi:hypothetical protein